MSYQRSARFRPNMEMLETRLCLSAAEMIPSELVEPVANQDFYQKESSETREVEAQGLDVVVAATTIDAAGLDVVVAAATTETSTPHADSGTDEVDLALAFLDGKTEDSSVAKLENGDGMDFSANPDYSRTVVLEYIVLAT